MFEIRANGDFIDANQAFAEMMGFQLVEELQGRNLYDFFPDPEQRGKLIALLGDGEGETAIFEAVGQGGKPVMLEQNVCPVRGQSKEVERYKGVVQDVTARRRGDERSDPLAEEREALAHRFATQFQSAPVAQVFTDREMRIVDWNPAAERIFGYTKEEALGKDTSELITAPGDKAHMEGTDANTEGDPLGPALRRCITKDGREVFCEWISVPDYAPDGQFGGSIAMALDVTERRHLQEQLAQAQKMESVGRLAGGIAHDFNNLLTAITGHADLALMRDGVPEDIREDLNQIIEAGERAAGLTGQLLAFARKQVMEPQVLDSGELVDRLGGMLRRIIGEDIELNIDSPSGFFVRADPSQIEQVLINLVSNARDAMPQGGTLSIETRGVSLTTEAGAPCDLSAGDYIVIAVADSGPGVDSSIREQIFEPFFTTKPKGKGTGLGLAMCYGIARQNGGVITLASRSGEGAKFEVYLPRHAALILHGTSVESKAQPVTAARRTVLLVEGDAQVRAVGLQSLQAAGYTVLEAPSGSAALDVIASTDEVIDLVVVDLVMPQMSGRQLADFILEVNPATKILFVSGYADNTFDVFGDGASAFLQKPYSPATLAVAVRKLLGAADAKAA
jgi:PAS domain S-box-containing protein